MNYTNGFDIDLVLPALQQRLGWKQPTVTGSPVINNENAKSISGRNFGQSFHAMCTVNNLKSNQEDPAISDDDFNEYLSTLQSDMIMRSLNEVFRSQELIEQVLLYTRFGYNDIPIVNSSQFVGYVINIANDKSIATQINFLTLYFTESVSIPIYLYEDGVKDPIVVFNAQVDAWERTLWELDGSDGDHPQLVLKFVRGRRYYLGYYQDDLGTSQGIREQIDDWATTRCFEAYPLSAPVDKGVIFPNSISIVQGVTPTPLVIPFTSIILDYNLIRTADNTLDWNTNVSVDGTNITILGDDDGTGHFATSYTFLYSNATFLPAGFGFNHNYRQFPFLPGGINMEMISFRDHTEKIIRKANLFDEMQGLQMAAFALELINHSMRTNRDQRQSEQQSQQTYLELNQAFPTKEMPVTPGLKSRIDREMAKLKQTFFPKQGPVSLPMCTDGGLDQLDAVWAKQNYRQLTNPPQQVIPSGG